MKKLLFLLFLFPALAFADDYRRTPAGSNDYGFSANRSREGRRNGRVFTGFTGGMLLHGGVSLAYSMQDMFSNLSINDAHEKNAFMGGIGGQLRAHLFDHIHIGGEGYMSSINIPGSKSFVRASWGGLMIDGYFTIATVAPFLGFTVGGGRMNRLYIPKNNTEVADNESVIYNSSYTQTPFFAFSPYVGMDIAVGKFINLQLKIDFLMPIGRIKDVLGGKTSDNAQLLKPNGPRIYLGIIFGH